MKTLTALFTAAALTLTAGLAQADVRIDQIPQLVKDGKIKSLESMNAEALKLHPAQRLPTPTWITTSMVTSMKLNLRLLTAKSSTWTLMPPPVKC